METITIHPQNNEQLQAIKSVLKAMKIPFEKKRNTYNPDFVKKIQGAEKQQKDSIVLCGEEDIDGYFRNLESDVHD